jgi:streptogrisin C
VDRRKTVAALAGVILIAGGMAAAGPASADATLGLPAQPALKAQENRGSIAYLTQRYKVSESEALRRLALQRLAPALDAALAAKYPNTFAGTYLDQEGGGRLVVNTTDPSGIRPALAKVNDSAHVTAQQVRWSLMELTATQARLNRTIGMPHETTKRKAEVTIDVPGNVVAVYQRAGMAAPATARLDAAAAEAAQKRPAAADQKLVAAAASEGGRAEVRQLIVGEEKTGTVTRKDTPVDVGCDPRQCTAPMRGGMRLNVKRSQAAPTGGSSEYLNAWYGQCTNGFNVSDNRGWNYIMTAGHCMVGQYRVGINYTYSAGGTPISYEVHNFENGCAGSSCGSTYPVDYSIQPYQVINYNGAPYNYYDYWSGPYAKNRVVSWCWWSSSTWQGCADGTFAIRGWYDYATIGVGWVVCGTGSGDASYDSGYTRNVGYNPGTRCGEVTSKDGGIRTNICSRPGDSGGSLFSEIDGMAYGILSTGYRGTGACLSPPGSEWSSYSSVSRIHEHIAVQLGLVGEPARDFRIRTTP